MWKKKPVIKASDILQIPGVLYGQCFFVGRHTLIVCANDYNRGSIFLRRLRLYGVGSYILLVFLPSHAWKSHSLWNHSLVWKLVCSTEKQIGSYPQNSHEYHRNKTIWAIQTLYEQAVMRRAISISTDPNHPLFSKYQPLPSGKRLRECLCVKLIDWSFHLFLPR